MVGFAMVVGCAVHKPKTPRSGNHSLLVARRHVTQSADVISPPSRRPVQPGGTDGLWTLPWRRQSAANPSRKWSSESRVFGGSDGKIWRRGTTCNRLDRPTAWGKGPFCRLSKERGGSTRSKFVQYGRLFSQLRFKAHNIGALATTINRGYCGRHTL